MSDSSGASWTAASTPVLEARDVVVRYRQRSSALRKGRDLVAVDGVSFTLPAATTLAVVGESGSGKTTLARAVLQLVPLASGSVWVDGIRLDGLDAKALRRMRRRIQAVFQDPYASLDPRRTVGELLIEPLEIHGVGDGTRRRARVIELMEMVGLDPSLTQRRPREFSGGQRQRICIARALALEPDVVVADEPISALDVSIQAQITNLLLDLQERLGIAYLYVAHDLAAVSHIAHRVSVMYLGTVLETGRADIVLRRGLHPYTLALVSAMPIPDPDIEAVRVPIILTGDPPSATDPVPGCRFASRCWLRTELGDPERCQTESPSLAAVGDNDHAVACHYIDEARLSSTRRQVFGSDPPERSAT